MKRYNRLLFHSSNFFIILSLFGFLFIFYPILSVYLISSPLEQPSVLARQKGMYLQIPKINAQARVIEQVDPWNEAAYNSALKKGIAHAKDTSLPGNNGTVFLFAHSSGAPWELTRYNTIFLRLGELQRGDSIEIIRNGKTYRYSVREKKEVFPTEVNYLIDKSKNQIILQTCTPIGTSYKRLLVFADPV